MNPSLKTSLRTITKFKDLPTFTPNFESTSQISQPFCLVIWSLKLLGNCPISIQHLNLTRGQSRLVFCIHWTNYWTIYSAIVGFFFILIWIIFLINFGLGTPFIIDTIIPQATFNAIIEAESDNSLGGLIRKTYLMTSTVVICETMARWHHSQNFVQFLTKWQQFEELLVQNFPRSFYSYNFSAVSKLRDNLILFYLVFPSLLVFPSFLIVYGSRLILVGKLLTICICFSFICISGLEDIKVLLSYKSIQEAFLQVRLLFTAHEEYRKEMTRGKAHEWRKLVQFIRHQAELAGRYQKIEELTRMVTYIALVTLFIFIILNGWDHARKRHDMIFMFSSIGYCCMLIIKIYFKAVMAENITHEEHKLVKIILDMDSRNWDSGAVLELKTLVDCIVVKPARICFGNYVVLNKRLLLGISTQIVSYLIVLMQFSQPN